MFDKLFKRGKKQPSLPPTQKPSRAGAKTRALKPEPEPQPKAATAAADTRSPEERCGITAKMPKPEIRAQLAKMFRRYNGLASSLDLASVLLDEVEIAAVPGDAFGAPGFLRFSFALSDENLVEGLTRLQEWAG